MRSFDMTQHPVLLDLRTAARLELGEIEPLASAEFNGEVERVTTADERARATERLFHARRRAA